ncbi:hypothetical protein [Hwanghaeella sp. LZ110]|uniref:5'-methylthioadenosine/S-adenosylhomocysteine nucleosidase family protein n=1 Tax=Hwanghaeella sp. LZ110 TaxID=3402810 RepID=UPI003B671538
MNILIVDDNPKRYGKLRPEIEAAGVSPENVDIVVSIFDAKRSIQSKKYDLLILDILIPLRPEDDAHTDHSVDFLFEVQEESFVNKPTWILGITSDREIASDAVRRFSDCCWTVLDYSETDDEWIKRTLNCVTYILGQDHKKLVEEPPIDLLIVCALQAPELTKVLEIPWNWKTARPVDDVTFVHDGELDSNGTTLSVCAASAPRMGMVETAILTTSLLIKLRPKIVAMTGICAGVREKVKLGDVLFADPAWNYQSGKQTKDKDIARLKIRPHHIPASTKIRSHIAQISAEVSTFREAMSTFNGDGPGFNQLRIGPVASGTAVLADGDIIKQTKDQQHQELIGVEMEIYGLFAAVKAACSPQPEVFALKGVCDFADQDKADECQSFAAFASARVLQLLMEKYGNRLV